MEKFDSIREIIENETNTLPAALSKESIVEMLNEKKIKPAPVKKKVNKGRILGMVATFAVVIAAAVIGFSNTNRIVPIRQPDGQQTTTAAAKQGSKNGSANIEQADSYDEIEDYFLSIRQEFATLNEYAYAANSDSVELKSKSASAAVAVATADGFASNAGDTESFNEADAAPESSESYGKTNTQVEGVDEADIIKNDGTYIYNVTDSCTVNITDTRSMSVASCLEIKSDEENTNLCVREIYVNGDRMIVLCSKSICEENENYNLYFSSYYSPYGNFDTEIFLYDISDRTSPKKLRSIEQNGCYNCSRLVDTMLYSISTYSVNTAADEDELKDKCIPTVERKRIDAESIMWEKSDDEYSRTYVVITAYDTAQPDSKVNSFTMLGYADEVYCTDKALYVSECKWEEDKQYTKIYSIAFNGTELSYKNTGKVPGTPLNQFSLDEYNGYFRIVTTSYSYEDYIDVSSLYVLDESLEIVGRLENLKYDESVRSVRFSGNTAYVVTFKNTDPLFVIDLSVPTAPVVKGEVKLPGFSAYMHPVGDGLVAGIGYNGDDENADYNSVKVSLFDVKNPEKPVEINSVVIECASTDVNYIPKAFMYYAEKSYIGIPLQIYKDDVMVNSLMVLRVTEKGLEKVHGFVHQSGNDAWSNTYFRGTYIGDSIFTVSDKLINGFSLESFEKTGSVTLDGYYEYEPYYDEYNAVETVKAIDE